MLLIFSNLAGHFLEEDKGNDFFDTNLI